jgi:hypothetical protein
MRSGFAVAIAASQPRVLRALGLGTLAAQARVKGEVKSEVKVDDEARPAGSVFDNQGPLR